MKNRGMTLLELMAAVSIFTIVMGVLFSLSFGFANAAQVQEIKVTTNDEARRALMVLATRLRQASRQTINFQELPGDSITFRMATDINGNGTAVDAAGNLELTDPFTIQRDVDDVNGDGLTMNQLIMMGDKVRVLANNLKPGEAPDGFNAAGLPPGALAPATVGFWVTPRDGGLEVTVRAQGRSRRGQIYMTALTEFIVPRN